LAEISASQPIQPPFIVPSGSRVLAVKNQPLAISGSNSLGGPQFADGMSKMPENASGKSFPAAQFSGVLDYGQTGTVTETIGEVVAQGTGSIDNISSSNRNINHSSVNTSSSNRNTNHCIVNTSNSNINIKSSNSGFINSNIINTTNISSNSYSSSLIFQTESELHQSETNLQQVGACFYPCLKVTLNSSIFLIRK
jgi:hypothetical protein